MQATVTSSSVFLKWLQGAAVGSLISLRVDCDPSPAHRPQVGKWGTFYAKSYQVCHHACTTQLVAQKVGLTLSGQLGVVMEFVLQKPKTTKLLHPKPDLDNLNKCPMDAATKAAVWGDDCQVVALASTKRWTAPGEKPGVNFFIGRLAA